MSTASEKANLARIRDNQRRSRARRKEYLQELEARLRQCELQGIEASAEIQQAARRVADENKKLRSLLAQHGVGEDNIEGYLQTSQTSDTLMNNSLGSNSVAVQVLEQLLQTRKACCADGNTGAPSYPRSGGSSGSGSTVQSIWDNTNLHRRSAGHQSGKAASAAQHYMTPSRTGSSIGSVGHRSSHSMSHHQRLNPVNSSQEHGQGSNMSNPSHSLDFDSHFSQSSQSPYDSPRPNQHQLLYMPITASSSTNVNSCVFAADMITTMAGASDPSAVRAELGCLPDMDCEVDNQLVFNVMDRYTSSSVGL